MVGAKPSHAHYTNICYHYYHIKCLSDVTTVEHSASEVLETITRLVKYGNRIPDEGFAELSMLISTMYRYDGDLTLLNQLTVYLSHVV